MATVLFSHAKLYDSGTDAFLPGEVLAEDGVIAALSHRCGALCAEREVDCGGAVLLPAFADTHLHLPGSYLYERHGVNLMGCESLEACREKLLHAGTDGAVLRGFGWNQSLFEEDPGALPAFQSFLNDRFPETPVILFSDDYHSCICSRALLARAEKWIPAHSAAYRTGLLKERMLFSLLHHLPELSFRPDEVRDALLAFQAMLFSRGITAVQTLMPIGMDEGQFRRILRELAEQGAWKLHTCCALTVHPTASPDEVVARYRALQQEDCGSVSLGAVKLYADGVVDNGSAYLREPYCTGGCGRPIWTDEALTALCTRLDREKIQIHVHTIGDAAAAQITAALGRAMAANGRARNENRHVLAHVQLAAPETAAEIGRLSLFCALQPFWFPQDAVYSVDRAMLGDSRTAGEYPCASLLRAGARVTFGSDSPVTPDPAPLAGMACAMARGNRAEALSFSQALDAYTAAAAEQLAFPALGAIAPGRRADLTLVRAPEPLNTAQGLAAASVEQTYIGGSCVYHK